MYEFSTASINKTLKALDLIGDMSWQTSKGIGRFVDQGEITASSFADHSKPLPFLANDTKINNVIFSSFGEICHRDSSTAHSTTKNVV